MNKEPLEESNKIQAVTKKSSQQNSFNWYRDFFKRFFDLLFSLAAFIVFLIPMCIIVLVIKLSSPSEKVLFKQERIGKNGKSFLIYKFRTMNSDAPHHIATEKFENPEDYITPIGEFLRKSSLDELPQLINVIKGQMSLVGPRPLIENENYVLSWREKLGADKVLPGITGLAQVHGRDELVGKKKAIYDGKYAKNISLFLDFKILLKTLINVLTSKGIREGKE